MRFLDWLEVFQFQASSSSRFANYAKRASDARVESAFPKR
jgi:hypothetical protein